MANGQPRGTIWLARSIYWLDAWSLQQSRLYSYAGNLSSESRQRCHYIWICTQLGGNNVLELVWLLVCGACVLERAPWRRQKMACGSKPRCSGCGSVCVLEEDWEEGRGMSGGRVGLEAEGSVRAGRMDKGSLLHGGFSACSLWWVGWIQGEEVQEERSCVWVSGAVIPEEIV